MAACPTPRIGRERFIFYYIYYRRTSISMWSVELLRIVCGIPRVCLPCRARAERRNMLKKYCFYKDSGHARPWYFPARFARRNARASIPLVYFYHFFIIGGVTGWSFPACQPKNPRNHHLSFIIFIIFIIGFTIYYLYYWKNSVIA